MYRTLLFAIIGILALAGASGFRIGGFDTAIQWIGAAYAYCFVIAVCVDLAVAIGRHNRLIGPARRAS
jgi:hypothetical protein